MKTVAIAFALGLGVTASIVVPWSALAGMNLRVSPNVPWSVPVIAVYLSVIVAYLNGWGWPGTTAATRRRFMRLRLLSTREWGWSLTAGILGVLALWALYAVFGGLSGVKAAQVAALPKWVLIVATLASAAITAIGEEAGFRGYMQAILESRFSKLTTILLVSVAFTLVHVSHGLSALARNGAFYFAASGLYAVLSCLTKSILPSMLLHFAGDVFLFALLSSLVHVAVPRNTAAWLACSGAAIVLGACSGAAFWRLARCARRAADSASAR
jgi:membrane protease YdiL (CAAX protease family)